MYSLSLVTRVIILYIWSFSITYYSILSYSILSNFYTFSQSHIDKLTI